MRASDGQCIPCFKEGMGLRQGGDKLESICEASGIGSQSDGIYGGLYQLNGFIYRSGPFQLASIWVGYLILNFWDLQVGTHDVT